jgi:hypothetical protein
MSRSSGTYTAPSNSWNPAVEGARIDESDFNTLLEDIETALTESVYTGGLGSTDNRLVRTDGTDTKKVQGTGITVDDSDNITGVASIATTTIQLGHASDTTLARSGAGDMTIEGNAVYRAGGTDVALADGGTGASLADPNADRVLFWDDSAGAVTWLTVGSGLSITGTTITASGGPGTGDVVGPASSVDGEIALYDSTTGKLIKRASTTGMLKATSGVLAAAVAGTDYAVGVPGETTLEAYGGAGDGVTDNTTAFNNILTAGIRTIRLGAGKVYRFSSAVNTITYGLRLVGTSKSTTVLDFYQASGNCLLYDGSTEGGGMIEKLTIRNRGGATLTSGIYLQAQAGGGSPDYCSIHDVNITGSTNSDLFSYGLLIDGNARTTGIVGIRNITVTNVSIFNTTASSWEVRHGKDITLHGLSCFATGTGGVNLGQIDGASGSTASATVRLNANMGDLYIDYASAVDVDGVYQAVYASANTSSFNIKGIATSVTIDASATNGRVSVQQGATISNSSSSTIVATVGGPSSSVDGEIALYDSTTGRLLKRASTTGLLKATSGVLAAAVAGTDYYQPAGTDVAVADGGTGASTAQAAVQNLSTWYVLARSGLASAHTGNTSETALATITIPANSMGPNGVLRVTIVMSMTNNANGKTGRVRLGGLAGTSFAAVALANFQSWRHQTQIQNRNATNSQIATTDLQVGFGASTAAVITGARDTTSSQDLVISGTLTNSGDTITLESYLVEVCHGA